MTIWASNTKLVSQAIFAFTGVRIIDIEINTSVYTDQIIELRLTCAEKRYRVCRSMIEVVDGGGLIIDDELTALLESEKESE